MCNASRTISRHWIVAGVENVVVAATLRGLMQMSCESPIGRTFNQLTARLHDLSAPSCDGDTRMHSHTMSARPMITRGCTSSATGRACTSTNARACRLGAAVTATATRAPSVHRGDCRLPSVIQTPSRPTARRLDCTACECAAAHSTGCIKGPRTCYAQSFRCRRPCASWLHDVV